MYQGPYMEQPPWVDDEHPRIDQYFGLVVSISGSVEDDDPYEPVRYQAWRYGEALQHQLVEGAKKYADGSCGWMMQVSSSCTVRWNVIDCAKSINRPAISRLCESCRSNRAAASSQCYSPHLWRLARRDLP